MPDRVVSSEKFPCNQTEWCAIPPGDWAQRVENETSPIAVNKSAMKNGIQIAGTLRTSVFTTYIFLIPIFISGINVRSVHYGPIQEIPFSTGYCLRRETRISFDGFQREKGEYRINVNEADVRCLVDKPKMIWREWIGVNDVPKGGVFLTRIFSAKPNINVVPATKKAGMSSRFRRIT